MGRRCRHLNPVHAGMTMALDARFISGVSNGASVETFAGRAGSGSATQSNATFRGTFNASASGGQPGVTLSASTNFYNFASVSSTTASGAAMFAGTATEVRIVGSTSTFGGVFPQWIHTTGSAAGFVADQAGYYYSGGYPVTLPSPAVSSGYHPTGFSLTSNTWTQYWHGAAAGSRTIGGGTFVANAIARTVGTSGEAASPPAYSSFNGNLCALSLAGSVALSASLMRRIQHSYAYSWKTPAS